MKINNHYLFDGTGKQVPFKLTPNHGGIIVPKYLIMHYDASSSPTGAVEWMLSKASGVSAHLHVTRDGKITQLAPFNVKCWHAGPSKWAGIDGLNSHSIGIELQNTGTQDYTQAQLEITLSITKALVDHYDLKDVLGHSDIAPGRKIDPGPKFPMELFKPATWNQPCGTRTTTVVNLRKGPGTDHGVITVLPKDTVVEVLTARSWSEVKIVNSNIHGWVSSKYLTK